MRTGLAALAKHADHPAMLLQVLCIQMEEVCTVASTTAAELPPEPTPLPAEPKVEAKVGCCQVAAQACAMGTSCCLRGSLPAF